jgi:trypsin-like peptidase
MAMAGAATIRAPTWLLNSSRWLRVRPRALLHSASSTAGPRPRWLLVGVGPAVTDTFSGAPGARVLRRESTADAGGARRWAGLLSGSAESSPGRFVVIDGDGAAARGVRGRGVVLYNGGQLGIALARLADVQGHIGSMAVGGAAVEFAAADPRTGLALLVYWDSGPTLAGPNGLDAADVQHWLAQLGVDHRDVARFIDQHRDVIDQVVPSGTPSATANATANAMPDPGAHAGTWTVSAGQALLVTAGPGRGTGFAVESGRVLTNEHSVRGVPDGQIRVNGHRATLIKTDPATDLAELHVPDLRVTGRLRLATARHGETVTIEGFPSGDASQVTARVLATDSTQARQLGLYEHPVVVVDDMPVGRDGIANGGSGAPMHNEHAEIVGMLQSGTNHPRWMGFGIRAEDIARFLDREPAARAGEHGRSGSPSLRQRLREQYLKWLRFAPAVVSNVLTHPQSALSPRNTRPSTTSITPVQTALLSYQPPFSRRMVGGSRLSLLASVTTTRHWRIIERPHHRAFKRTIPEPCGSGIVLFRLSDDGLFLPHNSDESCPFSLSKGQDGTVGAKLAVTDADPAGQPVGDLHAVILALGVAGLVPLRDVFECRRGGLAVHDNSLMRR